MKPILFNAEMTQAVREGRKTETRRVIKELINIGDRVDGKPANELKFWVSKGSGALYYDDNNRQVTINGKVVYSPYVGFGDFYVPEPWRCMGMFGETGYAVGFKDGETVRFMFRDKDRAERWAKYGNKPFEQWQSPYFMPREAARIFLRVEDVRPERLQSIETAEIEAEGIGREPLDEVGEEFYRGMFSDLWDSTIKAADRDLYGWAANPWVWVIQFKRIGEGASAE
ncbi:hypothetical protein [uncultured Dysosmobacter sp.]|uniref:hypothetical protein n=1 Tax=uncultured Dysosmobacter sp. TaxID=2591384 RepID=UPI0026208580|nr:hypothetical protein [uncultured Dysosmobacter sp.]